MDQLDFLDPLEPPEIRESLVLLDLLDLPEPAEPLYVPVFWGFFVCLEQKMEDLSPLAD